jgi:hypothetical protein
MILKLRGRKLTTMITTKREFEDEAAWEPTVRALAILMMPLTASGPDLDLRTGNTSIKHTSIIGEERRDELRNRLLPLLFGAAWKILDLALELAFAQAGLASENGKRWRIDEKSRHVAAHSGSLPGLSTETDIWHALGSLYAQTIEIRHALVHRRVHVDFSTLELTGYSSNGDNLFPLSYDEQMAFCRLAQRVRQTITEGKLRPRIEADLRAQLAALQRHHGVAMPSNASNKPPVRVIDDLPESGQIDVPHLLSKARTTFQWAQYVDVKLELEDGRRLVGELESAPQGIVTVDPAAPPDWLSLE